MVKILNSFPKTIYNKKILSASYEQGTMKDTAEYPKLKNTQFLLSRGYKLTRKIYYIYK